MIFHLIILVLILSLNEISSNSSYISLKFLKIRGVITILLKVGANKRNQYFTIDMVNRFNALNKNYRQFDSPSNPKEIIKYNDEIIEAEIKKELLVFPSYNIKFNNLYFYYFKGNFIDSISFSRTFLDNRNSIVHQLYNNKYINKLQFGIFSNSSILNGILYIGEIPKELYENKTRNTIKVNTNFDTWGIDIGSEIEGYFNSTHINYGYFNGKDKKILAPSSFMKEFEENVLSSLIKKKLCQKNKETYQCELSVFDSFPSLVIKSQGYQFPLKKEDLFFQKENYCILLIEENTKNKFYWEIGTLFLNKYSLIFDYESNEITIIHNNDKNCMLGYNLIKYIFT